MSTVSEVGGVAAPTTRGRRGRPRPGALRLRMARAKAAARFVADRPHRRRAVALAEYVAQGTRHEGHPRRVAYRRLTGRAVAMVAQADPALASRTELHGLHLLREARATGRGVILASVHSDAMWVAIRALMAQGIPLHIVVGPWFWDDTAGHGGTAHRRALEAEGVVLISTEDAGTAVPEVLRAGGVCVITFDIPGRRAVTLAGKRALVMPGTAKLAFRTGALVVPAIPGVAGSRPRLDVFPAVDPLDHANPSEVLTAVAAALDEPFGDRCHSWSPHTSELWPDTVAPYLWAFES